MPRVLARELGHSSEARLGQALDVGGNYVCATGAQLDQEVAELRRSVEACQAQCAKLWEEFIILRDVQHANLQTVSMLSKELSMNIPMTTMSTDRSETPGMETGDVSLLRPPSLTPPGLRIAHMNHRRSDDIEGVSAYHFCGSVWDLAILIGLGPFGTEGAIGALVTFIVLLVNVAAQTLWIGIGWYNFSAAEIDDTIVQGTLLWRAHVGHHHLYYDEARNASLVSRLCASDPSLHTSGHQFELYSHIASYLRQDAVGIEHFFVGKFLCLVALLCWFLMIAGELFYIFDLMRAIFSIPLGCDVLVMESKWYKVASISHCRAVFIGLLCTYRLLLTVLLAWGGVFFLVYTVEVQHLMENAAALAIILNIDELLFAALAPGLARRFLSRMLPLKMQHWPDWLGLDVKTAFMGMWIPASLVFVYALMIVPLVRDLEAVAANLCGNNKDFIWFENALRMVNVVPTRAFDIESNWNTSASVKHLAVLEAISQTSAASRPNSTLAVWVEGSEELSFAQAVDAMQPFCEDMLHGPFLEYMRYVASNQSISTCTDVKNLCTSITILPSWSPDGGRGAVARMLCPITCGCAQPMSDLMITTGCPSKCTASGSFPPFDAAIARASCTEMNVTDLQRSSTWRSWIRQLVAFANTTGSTGDAYHELFQVANDMQTKGCGAFSSEHFHLCRWKRTELPFKRPTALCPRTCGCHMPKAQETQIECPEAKKCWQGCTTVSGRDCVFPFREYNGKRHTRCGKGVQSGKAWCATKVCNHTYCDIAGNTCQDNKERRSCTHLHEWWINFDYCAPPCDQWVG